MKKIKLTNKKIAILISIILVVGTASIFGINYYQEKESQKKIDTYITEISNIHNDFINSDSRDKKLQLLNTILNKFDEYKKSDNNYDTVADEYEKEIVTIKRYFIEDYKKVLEDNILSDINEIKDIELLSKSRDNLQQLSTLINNETNIICTNEEAKDFDTKINEFISLYDSQISILNEEKIKQEQQVLEQSKQQQESNQTSSNGINGSNNSGNNNSNGNNGGSNGNGSGGGTEHWSVDENGNKIPGSGSYVDDNGHVTQEDGSEWDLNDWLE